MKTSISALTLLLVANAYAWMEPWAPKFDCSPAGFRTLPEDTVEYLSSALKDSDGSPYDDFRFGHTKGVALDLNGDGTDDIALFIPYLGCGLAANGYSAHFLVSDGEGGCMENILECYGAEPSDLVNVDGKTYFRQSNHVWHSDKSEHNYWVYQMFSFGTNGLMKCANDEIGDPFPAITIHYETPRFEPADLEPAVRKEIAEEAKPVSRKFERPERAPVNGDRSGPTNRLDRIADIEVEFSDPARTDRVSEKPE